MSIQYQCFPRLWGKARVVPVYKNKGRKSDPLCIFRSAASRGITVCEQLANSQLCDLLGDNRCLDDRQHGYWRRRDTCLTVLHTVDEVVRWLGGWVGVLGNWQRSCHSTVLRSLTLSRINQRIFIFDKNIP